MSDYGDTSGGYSDQAIRDIVAAVQGGQSAPPAAAAPVGVMPAPEVTPTMTYVAPSAPDAPGAPLSILTPVQQADMLTPAVTRAKEDDWMPPAPTMAPPAVTPLGALATVPRPRAPTMGVVLGR